MKYTVELFILCNVILSTVGAARSKDDSSEFEFGRMTSPRSKGRKLEAVEIFFRDLMDEDIVTMSMSMSMSMSHKPQPPTPSPVSPTDPPVTASPAPQGQIVDDGFNTSVGCDEQRQTVVSLDLEVETVIGKATFSNEVVKALKAALSDEYSFCDFPRRKRRNLEEQVPILVGDVVVVEEAGSCNVESDLADQCRFARLDIQVSGWNGQDVAALIEASVQNILEDSTEFDDQLITDGIVDVRLRDDSSAAPIAALTSGGATPPPGSPATTAVVTIAATAAIVLFALAFKRSRQKGGYDNLDAKDADGQSYANTAPGTVASSTAVAI